MTPTTREAHTAARHVLKEGALVREDGGIIGRCVCGWTTGYRISSFAASAAFQDHQDTAAEARTDG